MADKMKFKFLLAPQDILSIALLAACYPLAQILPPECGWENGLIENTQAVLLLFGAMFCFNCAYYSVIIARTILLKGLAIRWAGCILSCSCVN